MEFPVLDDLYFLINYYAAPLYVVAYQDRYIFIDYWSFGHFIFGLSTMWIACQQRCRRPFFILGWVLLFWELIELSIIYLGGAIHILRPETLLDQVSDIVIGFAAGSTGWLLRRWKGKANPLTAAR